MIYPVSRADLTWRSWLGSQIDRQNAFGGADLHPGQEGTSVQKGSLTCSSLPTSPQHFWCVLTLFASWPPPLHTLCALWGQPCVCFTVWPRAYHKAEHPVNPSSAHEPVSETCHRDKQIVGLHFDSLLSWRVYFQFRLLTRTQLGVFEFLCFSRFGSPLRSSRTKSWKSVFRSKGKEKLFVY